MASLIVTMGAGKRPANAVAAVKSAPKTDDPNA
jgi:hypothetical protein